VQWGPFADATGTSHVGLAARGGGARLAERGMTGFSPGEAWSALAGWLDGDEPVIGYVPLDLRRWFDAYPETAAQNTWQSLRDTAQTSSAPAPGSTFCSELAASPEATRRDLVEAKVRELACRVLRLDPRGIDGATPLKALGLDSLMGLELRNRLESTFGLQLSPTLLWTYGSPRALAGALCERVLGAPAS